MPENEMHFLRRWARDNVNQGNDVVLTAEEARRIAKGIETSLSALDELWETVAGRKLTLEEKGLSDG